MAANGSQEEIDFDFFDEDDNRGQSRDKSPAGIGGEKSRSRPSSGRPESVRSTTSSLSIKIPTANNTPRERKENRYSSDEEDDYSPKGVNGYDEHDQKKGKSSDRSRSTSGESTSSKSRSKKSRSRHSSGTSNSSASYSSSLDSKSAESDSSSSSESVTDVSPIQSPLSRSPSPPRLRYNHDEMELSLAKSSKKLAKDSVCFKEPSQSPKSGFVRPPSGSRKNPQLEESEANELSMLLRAVLEMEETPQRRFHDFDQPRLSNSRPSSGKRPMSGKAMPHQRMNMSFSNDEVKKIDQDNQRLLQKIMNSPSSVPKPKKERPSSGRMRTRSASYGPIPQARPASGHVSHSALLRQKDQRRIEMENMKILKRIESAKPTSQLQANKLKKDFRKQQQYAQQVSRTPVRPSSAKRAGNTGMTKATSLQSLRSEASSTASSRVRSRPSSAKSSSRPSWDEHFAY